MPKSFIQSDGEVGELGKDFFVRAKRGRPSLPEDAKKRRVNLMLDPDVSSRLQQIENASSYVNAILRERLGL